MMQYKFRLFVVFLVISALSLGTGGTVNLYLTPDGNTHISQGNSSCELFNECLPGSGELVQVNSLVRCQSSCLAINSGGDLLDPTNRNIVQISPPTLAPFGQPPIPIPSNNKPFHVIPLNTLPQFSLQKSVVLLI